MLNQTLLKDKTYVKQEFMEQVQLHAELQGLSKYTQLEYYILAIV